MAGLNTRLKTVSRKIGKNQPLAVEYFIGYSPDANINTKEYLSSAVKWVIDKHGKENILNIAYHFDEKTPHVHVLLTPIAQVKRKSGRIENSLSAKRFFNGPKAMSDLQTEFAEKVGKVYGLERGEEKSGRKHIPVRVYRAKMAELRAEAYSPEVPRKLRESKKELLKEREKIEQLTKKIAMLQKTEIANKEAGEKNYINSRKKSEENKILNENMDILYSTIVNLNPDGSRFKEYFTILQNELKKSPHSRHPEKVPGLKPEVRKRVEKETSLER